MLQNGIQRCSVFVRTRRFFPPIMVVRLLMEETCIFCHITKLVKRLIVVIKIDITIYGTGELNVAYLCWILLANPCPQSCQLPKNCPKKIDQSIKIYHWHSQSVHFPTKKFLNLNKLTDHFDNLLVLMFIHHRSRCQNNYLLKKIPTEWTFWSELSDLLLKLDTSVIWQF